MGYSFKHGWVRQPYDPRDRFLLTSNERAASLPAWAEAPFAGVPQLDQGAEGSCGPNTAEELILYDQLLQGLPEVGASRLFIYWFTRQLMGTVGQDSGVDNRSMCKALASCGFPAEALWPYDDTTASMVRKPTAAVQAAALANKDLSYAAVVQSPAQMQGVLSGAAAADVKPRPLLFGFDVFQQIQSDQAAATGILTAPSQGETPIGGHDISLIGYTTVDRPGVKAGNKWPAGYYKGRNHWMNGPGEPWGDDGYAYVPFAYAHSAAHAGDFWVFNAIQGGVVPTPTPTPTPPPTPPPNPPPPPPAPPPSVLADVNRAFAELEAMLARRPTLLHATQFANAYVDAWLKAHGYK